MTENIVKTRIESPSSRKPYTAPTLRDFGKVGTLTQGGSLGVTETGTGMMNPNQMA